MPQPVYDDEKDTPTLPSDDDLRDTTGISKSEESAIDEDAAKDVSEKEDAFASGDKKKQDKAEASEEPELDFYNANAAAGFSGGNRFQRIFSTRKRKGLLFGGVAGVAAILATIGIGGIVPFQIVHVKEVVAQNLGGIQEDMVDKRRMRIMQKAYFFREDGKFDGYKSKGSLFSFLDNRQSTKLLDDLRTRGYEIKPEITTDGKWTGRIESITGPDGKALNDSDSFWAKRSAIKGAIDEIYPAKSGLWRNKQTSLMYKRYGLVRSNWWNDYATSKKINFKERLKERIRAAMTGATGGKATNTPVEPKKDDSGKPLPGQEAGANGVNGGLQDAIDQEADAIANGGDTPPLNGDTPNPLQENPAKAVGSGVLNVIKITGVVDSSCQIIGTANTIAKTSRAAKALQLAKYSSLILSAADATKAGQIDGKVVNDLMVAMNSMDPQTKKNFFGSGGWLSISTKQPVKSTYGTTYDAGGGFSGQIQSLLNKIYPIAGGKAGVRDTCGKLANPFVQVGSAIVGIGAIIFTGGGVAVGQVVGQAGLQVAKQLLLAYGTQLAVKAATGSIIDGTEVGERMGDAFTSGAGTMFAMNGASRGLRPITQEEYAVQQSEYEASQQARFAQLPLHKRLFNLEDRTSLGSKSLDTIATLQNNGVVTSLARLPSSFATGLFGKSNVQAEQSLCTQEDIVNSGLKTDAFCNPIYGNTDAELNKIDPLDNLIWMYDNGYVDGEGAPNKEFITYTEQCFESPSVSTLFADDNDFVSDFKTDCFDKGQTTTGGIGLHERFRAFRFDQGLLDCLNSYMDTGVCDEQAQEDSTQVAGTDTSGLNSQQVLALCNAGPVTGKLKIVCATTGLNGVPYDSYWLTDSNWDKKPSRLGCNSYANFAIARATNGYYIENYCSGGYLRQGVDDKKFRKIAKEDIQPGDLIIHDDLPAGGSGCGGTSGSGHVEVVVSYDKATDKLVTTGAHRTGTLSGVLDPNSNPVSSSYWSYGMEYIGGGL